MFLGLSSSLEAALAVKKVCAQPCVDLRIRGLSVCSGYTPAAAITDCFSSVSCACPGAGDERGRGADSMAADSPRSPPRPRPPCGRSPAGAQELPRYVSTSQSLSGNSGWDSGSRHGNRRAFVPSPAISAGTRPPAGLPGDSFPVMGG